MKEMKEREGKEEKRTRNEQIDGNVEGERTEKEEEVVEGDDEE